MEQVKIGWASRDISTTKPVNIPGQFHMRISKGVMDPVTVNALVLDSGEDWPFSSPATSSCCAMVCRIWCAKSWPSARRRSPP